MRTIGIHNWLEFQFPYSLIQFRMEKNYNNYVSRVNQLDADLLDREITKIIHEQLANVFDQLPPGLLSKFQPEIDCFLRTLVWVSSIQRNKSTFGQQILAITYQKERLTRNRLIFHYVLTIFSTYAKDVSHLRFTNKLLIQKSIEWIECLIRIVSLLNFFRFLKVGRYPSLMDYVLGWNHVSQAGTKMRNVGYAYMNRELVWMGFMELLNVTVPLINCYSLKRKVLHILRPSKVINQQTNSEITMDVHTKCAICNQRPSLPHHIRCQHVFCYFCLRGNVTADPQFRCPICDHAAVGDIFSVIVKLED